LPDREYWYRLVEVDIAGGKTYYGPVIANLGGAFSPAGVLLLPNRPNPFSNETVISYQTSGTQLVSLNIYNISGQLVRTLREGTQSPGLYNTSWDGRDRLGRRVPNGIYICRLNTGSKTLIRKMTLVR
jgi:hypothetical protein